MNSQEAHEIVLGLADAHLVLLDKKEPGVAPAQEDAVSITRRDLHEYQKIQRRASGYKQPPNEHDDIRLNLAQVKVLWAKYQSRSMADKDQTFEQFLDTVNNIFGEYALVVP